MSYAFEDLILFDDAYTEVTSPTPKQNIDSVAQMKAQLNMMTMEDKTRLAYELSAFGEEDFQAA
jgi:hypothetical protein